MSKLSINLGAVEANLAAVTGQLNAAGDANKQHQAAYNNIASDGSGSTVASATEYAMIAQKAQARVANAVTQANSVARTAATEAVTIDRNSSVQFAV